MTTKTTYQTTREASRKIGATIPKSEHKIPRKDLARIAGVDIVSHFVATTCPLTAEFLDHVIRANTVNRPRNWEHCGQLSGAIQVDYQPCLTDFAVTVDGRTCNGGHSGAAIAQSFFPSDVWEPMGWVIVTGPQLDQDGNPITDDNGDPILSTEAITPPLVYQEEGEPVDNMIDRLPTPVAWPAGRREEWEKAVIAKDRNAMLEILNRFIVDAIPDDARRVVSLKINCPPDIVRKYDTKTRPRTGAEQLQFYAPARLGANLAPIGGNYRLLAAVLRQAMLCANKGSGKENKDGWTAYGTPSGGGNTSAELYPALFDAFFPILERHLAASGLEWDEKGQPKVHANRSGIEKQPKDLLVALIRTTDEGAKRLGELLRSNEKSPALAKLKSLIEVKTAEKKAVDASTTQAYLVAASLNRCPKQLEKDSKDAPIPQQLAARSPSWDIGDKNDEGELYDDVLTDSRNAVDGWFARHVDMDLSPASTVEADNAEPVEDEHAKKPRRTAKRKGTK
jgi:hypothetical protein